jgi:signal transduction histidine kinase
MDARPPIASSQVTLGQTPLGQTPLDQTTPVTSGLVLQPDRLAELDATALLDSPVEEAFDRFTRLASTILKTPVALVSLVDRDRQFFKSSIGLQEPWASDRQTPLSHSFCQHVVEHGELLSIVDARCHPLLKTNLAVTELGVVAYLGIPITTSKGHTLGSFCAIDSQPREWTVEETTTLRELTALRSLERFRDETVQMLVHDLRNPLMSFLGGLELTQKHGGLTVIQTRYVDIASRGGQALLQMINNILDTRTADSPLITLNKSEVSADRIIQDACEQMISLADKSGVRLSWETDGWLTCQADADKLRRVLVNLVGNAIQHTPPGETVLVIARSNATGGVLFSVTDTGHGIPRSAFVQLFDGIDRAQRHWVKGTSTGLGLPFSKMAIEAHGGRIWMESELGQGTVFYFTIP